MEGARIWSTLTTEVKLSMLCQGAHDKKWVMLVHFCKLFRQYYVVILGTVQIMMCKYSNVIKPDPFLCQPLFSSSNRFLWGGNTSLLLDQDSGFICSTAIYIWLRPKFVLQKRERYKYCPNWYNSKEN